MEKTSITFDQVDLQILRLMQDNGRINNADIARELGMAPSAILERVKKLEQKEVILGYTAVIDPTVVGQKLLSYIFIKANEGLSNESTGIALAEIPEVQEVHEIAGDDGYLVKVRTADSAALIDLMRNTFSKIPNIISTRTTIVLDTVKENLKVVI